MSIDRLSSTSALIAALRAEMTRKGDRARGGGEARLPQRTEARDPKQLRRELADIVKDVSVDDEEAMKQARTRVIRATLLWEFGAGLREYSEWQPMIETVAQTLERNDAHRQSFAKMVRGLQPRKR